MLSNLWHCHVDYNILWQDKITTRNIFDGKNRQANGVTYLFWFHICQSVLNPSHLWYMENELGYHCNCGHSRSENCQVINQQYSDVSPINLIFGRNFTKFLVKNHDFCWRHFCSGPHSSCFSSGNATHVIYIAWSWRSAQLLHTMVNWENQTYTHLSTEGTHSMIGVHCIKEEDPYPEFWSSITQC